MKKRVARFMTGSLCPTCKGKRLKREALEVKFADHSIAALSHLSLSELESVLTPAAQGRYGTSEGRGAAPTLTEEKRIAAQRIARNVIERIETLRALGLGYLAVERSTPSLSPGELQRLRLATQIRSNLFGVVYVLDEPSAGSHPADTEALIRALNQLKEAGNSLFVVEHDLELMRHADWIVDVGPEAGEHGGRVLYSGPPAGLRRESRFSYGALSVRTRRRPTRAARAARLAAPQRNPAQQSQGCRCRVPHRGADRGDRSLGIREIEPRESIARRAHGRTARHSAARAAR